MMMTRRVVVSLLGGLILVPCISQRASAFARKAPSELVASDFGYRSLAPRDLSESTSAQIERPLVVLMVDFEDQSFAPGHTPEYFAQRIFGEQSDSLRNYYRTMSGGKFTFRNAGVYGPVRFPNDPMTTENESIYDCYQGAKRSNGQLICPSSSRTTYTERATELRLLAQAGFDYRPFDTATPRLLITNDDIFVMVVWAERPSHVGGAVRTTSPSTVPISGQNVSFQGKVGVISEHASMSTTAHEMSHVLGTYDFYGLWGMANGATSLMGATGGQPSGATLHLDPWHKMALGFDKPAVSYGPDFTGKCMTISASHVPSSARGIGSLLLYESKNYKTRYTMIEYRRKGAETYENQIPNTGIGLWYGQQAARNQFQPYPIAVLSPEGVPLVTQVQDDDVSIANHSVISTGPNQVLNSASSVRAPDRVEYFPGFLHLGRESLDDRGQNPSWFIGAGNFIGIDATASGARALRWPDGSAMMGLSMRVDRLESDHASIWLGKSNETAPTALCP